jgi:hypothetical protein
VTRHRDPHRDHGGHLDHPTALPDLVERGIEPDVGVLAFDRAREERLHVLVQHLAEPGDLALGDSVHAERTDQVVDLAGRDALHVGLHDHGLKRPLGAPAGLQ